MTPVRTPVIPTKKPRVDPEFAAFLPRPSRERFAALEKQILTEGCLEPLTIWAEEWVIVDGMTRFEICTKHKLPYTVISMEFGSREQILDWMAAHQLGKRNLTDEQTTYFIGKQYNLRKQAVGGQKGGDHNDPPAKTAETIAKEQHTSPATVKRAGKYADAVDKHEQAKPGAKDEILAGKGGSKKRVVESAPILCDRCKRVGAVRNCPECAAKATAKKKPRSSKRPRQIADFRTFEKLLGQTIRAFDQLFADLEMKDGREYREANEAMNKFTGIIEKVKGAQK